MIRVFPVAREGSPHFTDDFAYVRPGAAKKHGGIDIFADAGAPVFAVDDGEFEPREDPIGGHAFYLHALDGTTYYGAHLSAYEGGPRTARAGEVIGYVGQTGNAAGTSPHLHFEVHPSGGVGVDPFRALSALEPQSASDVRVLPSPAPAADPLPRLPVVPGPVPPIPHEGEPIASRARRGSGGGVFAFFGLVGLGLVATRGRR